MALKFYLHDAATSDTGSLPGASSQSSKTPDSAAVGAYTNRSMDGNIGVSQTSIGLTLGTPTYGSVFRRFLSLPLAAQTISGTVQIADAVSQVTGAGWNPRMMAAIWRPGSGTLVGRLWDGPLSGYDFSSSASTETAATGTAHTMTNQTILDQDILIVELWSSGSDTPGSTCTMYYDGTTEGSSTTNAAYILFSNDIPLYTSPPPRSPLIQLLPQ